MENKKQWNPAYLKLQGLIIKHVFDYYKIPVIIFEDGGCAIDMKEVMANKDFSDKFFQFMKDKREFLSKYIPHIITDEL